mmetsp:Transcript_5174/g.18135  ORF Transcript_5174/g.18135 Transcript_5174/m.18135 type:complete len:243 (+) Transcript_5174:176-904(+)
MAPIRDQSPLKAASTRPAVRRRESAGRAPRRRTDPCPGPSPLVAHGRPPSSRPRLETAHRLPRKPLHPALTDPKSPPNFRGLIPPGSLACGLARPPLPSSPLLRRLWRSGLRRRSRVFLSSWVVGSIPTGCFFCVSSFPFHCCSWFFCLAISSSLISSTMACCVLLSNLFSFFSTSRFKSQFSFRFAVLTTYTSTSSSSGTATRVTVPPCATKSSSSSPSTFFCCASSLKFALAALAASTLT